MSSLLAVLSRQQERIEHELIDGLRAATDDAVEGWPPFERERSFEQTVNLGEGRDCNYDRPTVGVAYSTWYLPRRIHDATRVLAKVLWDTKEMDITVLDLGCGTGATWWACKAIVAAMREIGREAPAVRIIGCDTSLPMLRLAVQLWDRLPVDAKELITIETRLASWTRVSDVPLGAIVVASYLMDQSDSQRIAELGRTLRRLADQCMSRTVIVVGASNKRQITGVGIREFLGDGREWSRAVGEAASPRIWAGEMPELARLRRAFAADCQGVTAAYSRGKTPSWTPDGADYFVLWREPYESLLPLLEQSTFVLDESQDIAATPDHRMTAILGAAGSGKSRVLIERIARTVIQDLGRSGHQSHYLVTCFNHGVRLMLRSWFTERLSIDSRLRDSYVLLNSERVVVSGRILVDFVSWDAVILRNFGVQWMNVSSEDDRVMEGIVRNWANRSVDNADWLASNPWVTPKFVLQELKRVVYGQAAYDRERYLVVRRRGRPPLPRRGQDVREELWRLLSPEGRRSMWVDRRIAALRAVESGFEPVKYQRIFLDECQDFTASDFQLISSSIRDLHDLVVCGDGAQAMNTGSGYFRPPSVGGLRWKVHQLDGSYRLPIRICEAVEPVARAILHLRVKQVEHHAESDEEPEDITLPRAVKSAVVGIRPVILAPPDVPAAKRQVTEVLAHYREYIVADGSRPVVTNADRENSTLNRLLRSAIFEHELGLQFETTSMLVIKGLERPCIVWSTRFSNSSTPGASTFEWIYTIMTRPTRLLVIVLSGETPVDVQALVGRMRRDCLLFWDAAAEKRFDEFQRVVGSDRDPFPREVQSGAAGT